MSHTLTLAEFLAVRGLLRAGQRHAEIARTLDLSVWTVARIASEPQLQGDDLSGVDLPVDDAPADFVARDLRRCRGCGAMVYRWPCLACQMANSPRLPMAADEADTEDEGDELLDLLEEVARS